MQNDSSITERQLTKLVNLGMAPSAAKRLKADEAQREIEARVSGRRPQMAKPTQISQLVKLGMDIASATRLTAEQARSIIAAGRIARREAWIDRRIGPRRIGVQKGRWAAIGRSGKQSVSDKQKRWLNGGTETANEEATIKTADSEQTREGYVPSGKPLSKASHSVEGTDGQGRQVHE